jgi:hypothetical protein
MPRYYGVMAEFTNPEQFLVGIRRARAAGFKRMDAYTPNPLDGLSEAMELPDTPIPKIVLTAGVLGAVTGFMLQYVGSAIHYPINVGGRPLNSWPAFIPITFELAVLFGGLAAMFIGILALNGLPCPHHPVFNIPAFARASRDRFFLCIEARDPAFDRRRTREFLESLGPVEVYDVED